MKTLDLNCDMGEGFGAWKMGDDKALLDYVTSANIACGFHAGDPGTIHRTVKLALQKGVAVGAHPSLPDLLGFGRRRMNVSATEAYDMVLFQIGAVAGFATACGGRLAHVKPHGALYNMAVKDRPLADAIARAVASFDRSLILFGLPNSDLVRAGQSAGLRVAVEGFADRAYEPDGSLTPRSRAGAVVHDEAIVVRRALRMATEGVVIATDGSELAMRVDTICTHGDTPGAQSLTRALRTGLEQAGVRVAAVAGSPR